MNFVWLGHGSMRIESGDTVLLIDPWLNGNPMLPEDRHEAALAGATHILLTHAHIDHIADVLPLAQDLNLPVLGQYDLMSHWGETKDVETIGFNRGGTVEAGGVAVTLVPASHSSTVGTPDGPVAVGSECGFMLVSASRRTMPASGERRNTLST